MADAAPTSSEPSTHIQWMWNANTDPFSKSHPIEWRPYSDADNLIIEEAYKAGKAHAILSNHRIDLKKKLQISNSDSSRQRPITRMVSTKEEKSSTLLSESNADDIVGEREKLMERIHRHYNEKGKHQMAQVQQKNILLIGRARAGKSTIKQLLTDPTVLPNELSLTSGTKNPSFESFHIHYSNTVLNIIDTPGLFEHGATETNIRDNETILHTIEMCVKHEITKLHVICFCISLTVGINMEDILSLKMLFTLLGNKISENSCLIITRCESRTKIQQAMIHEELLNDEYFREIAPLFKLGIFFSGALNRDDYKQGNYSLLEQYLTISDYRMKLIELFTSDIEPFLADDLCRYYKWKGNDNLKIGNISSAQQKEEVASQIHSEMKRVHKTFAANDKSNELLVLTPTTLVCLKSKLHDDINMQDVKNLLNNIISSYSTFYDEESCYLYVHENEVHNFVFVIIETHYDDSAVTRFQKLPNVKKIYRYGQTSSKNEISITNHDDLCFELIHDLITFYNKLGMECDAKKDFANAKNMYLKAHELCNLLVQF